MTDNEALSAKALSLISHKLRTPLSIINGYSEAVLSQAEKEKFSPFTTKALEEINKQGSRPKLFAKWRAKDRCVPASELQRSGAELGSAGQKGDRRKGRRIFFSGI